MRYGDERGQTRLKHRFRDEDRLAPSYLSIYVFSFYTHETPEVRADSFGQQLGSRPADRLGQPPQ